MVELIMIICSIVAMVRAADSENRSTVLWGFITFLICIGCIAVIPLPILNIIIGLVLSFAAMTTANIIQR